MRACVLCAILLALSSSPWSQLWPLCQVCEWMDSPGSPPPSLSHFPSPLPSGPSSCPLIIFWPMTHQCLHSFIHSFTGKIFESLIATALTDSFAPFFTFFSKRFLSWTHCLVYVSILTHLLQASSILHKKIISFYEKKKRQQICVLKGLLRVMSLFHKIIWFSKVPFKQKQSTVNSDIL